MNKQELFNQGVLLTNKFCTTNSIPKPNIYEVTPDSIFYNLDSCAFYRKKNIQHKSLGDNNLPENYCIAIMINKCASIGTAGRLWSYPGYVVDRTPYGVLQHELGHHVDLGLEYKREPEYQLSVEFYKKSLEEPLTGYCPGIKGKGQWCSEWFAEIFRLFVTNPHLLSKLRPKAYELLFNKYKIVEERSFDKVLESAPQRTIDQTYKKIMSTNK